MKFVFENLDKVKQRLKAYFVSSEGVPYGKNSHDDSQDSENPKTVRKKHIRVGVVIIGLVLSICYFGFSSSLNPKFVTKKEQDEPIELEEDLLNKIDIAALAQGVSNERIWIEGAEKEIDLLKQNQVETKEEQGKLKTYIEQDKVSKDELEEIFKRFEENLENKYSQKLSIEIGKLKEEEEKKTLHSAMESKSFTKPKRKKIGEYIPAGSYVEAKVTSGVDAGIGISAEADPRQVLLRLTGRVVSAGIAEDYTSSDQLMGCTVLCRAIGDISSEKAYLNTVVLSCSDKNHYIELPIKGFISSMGKAGIRGEVVSREGDMVLNSFLAGIAGGFGSGIATYSQPTSILYSSGNLISGEQKAKDIGLRGLGNGISNSSERLSDYFIKRAEQYQPVISINEGTEVYIVLQEGFSLTEDENDKK